MSSKLMHIADSLSYTSFPTPRLTLSTQVEVRNDVQNHPAANKVGQRSFRVRTFSADGLRVRSLSFNETWSQSAATPAAVNTRGVSLAKQSFSFWLALLRDFLLVGMIFANAHDWAVRYSCVALS